MIWVSGPPICRVLRLVLKLQQDIYVYIYLSTVMKLKKTRHQWLYSPIPPHHHPPPPPPPTTTTGISDATINPTLHRLDDLWPSWFTHSPGRKMLCTSAVGYNHNKFPKKKHCFLSDLSSKSSISMCFICMITKGYKMFLRKLCQSKNGVCDESPPKRWTAAETLAWRLS